LAFELSDLAETMLRQTLRRKHPEAGEDRIEAMVLEWRLRRPGAEYGDCEGRPVPWPRST
jgi:hypothetical protein